MRITTELRKRSKNFGSMVIRIFITLPKAREEVRILGRQMLRSGTSVAAHTREASRARSDSEFCSKLDQLLQEADECQLWVEYLKEDCQLDSTELQSVHQEANELISIFTTIVHKVRNHLKS
jgi:four helix bundle protein